MSLDRPAIEPASLTWREIDAWARDRIEKARTSLETPGASDQSTEFTRGKIRALRDLLILANPPAPIPGSGGGQDFGT